MLTQRSMVACVPPILRAAAGARCCGVQGALAHPHVMLAWRREFQLKGVCVRARVFVCACVCMCRARATACRTGRPGATTWQCFATRRAPPGSPRAPCLPTATSRPSLVVRDCDTCCLHPPHPHPRGLWAVRKWGGIGALLLHRRRRLFCVPTTLPPVCLFCCCGAVLVLCMCVNCTPPPLSPSRCGAGRPEDDSRRRPPQLSAPGPRV
jgi:hypothetical protein